ncbi:c-type cytochrome [Afifella pfennigii]|uniref:c-type cytochrome n=1 Tax=Afifella pfennigii TaxID=209897 RepID=UPI00047872B1|nr:cytochrome c [Afifella pfennigii]
MSKSPKLIAAAFIAAACLAAGLLADERTAHAEEASAPAEAAPEPRARAFGLGREATPEEIAAWDIDIRPDGAGLPAGSGTVLAGDELFQEQCAVCHGVFGEGAGRYPVLAGGFDTLTKERPEKTVGSYWPYLSTLYDYIRRAMPFGNAHSLTDDQVYALTAYLLYLNDIVTDEDFELSKENFAEITLPNEDNFVPDDRMEEAHYRDAAEPCMKDCKPDPAKVVMRARILDVTPGSIEDDEGAGAGAVD